MKIRARLSHTPSRPAVAASLWLLLIGCGLWLAPKALTASAPQEAVYTGEQAQRGRALYDQKCASCHGLQLEGTSASALAGPRFMSKWGRGNHTLDELYLLTRAQMPYGAGNTLTPQQYIEIIAYVLNANGYPAGARALPASPPALQQIKIVPQAMGKEQMTRPAPDSKPQATQAAGAPSTSSPTQQELSAAQANMNDWLHSNHDYAGQRYVDLKEITPQNVARLRPAGMYQVGDTRAFHNNPLVYRGVMYVTTTRSTIALNAANGKLRWRYDRNPKSIELHAPNRGAAIKDGRVVRTTTDGYLYALDMETGRPLWEKKIVPVEKNEGTFNGAPVIFENLVVIGLGISEQGVKGWVGAFKLDSGEPVWRFNTIPDDGEPGAETWGKPDAKLHGGGAVWAPMSLDSERGLLYIPVANPAPDFLDSVRPGANLYTSSMVVLDVRTGKRQWHYQLVPHDTHDWDATQASPLFTAKVNGKTRNLVAAGGKDGLLHVLDRDTREHLYETAVTTRQNTDAPLTPEGVHACPGVLGGMQWNGPAFNPQTNMLYVPSVDWCGTYKKDKEDEARLVPGQLYMGGSYVEDPIETAHGWLTAIDASTGKVAWQYRSSKPMLAAVTTTSTGLVFAGELTGDLLALDARTGKVLYRFNVGGPMNGGLISYAVNGKQYIAAMSGSASAFWKAVPGASTVVIFSLPDSRDLGR